MNNSSSHEDVAMTAPSGSGDAPNTNVIGDSNVNIVHRGDGNWTHVGHDNRYNRGIVVNGSATFPSSRESAEILNELRRAPSYYDSSVRKQGQECMSETRVAILNIIDQWAEDGSFNNPRIFWLHGPAGTGKSTIAHTVAAKYRRQGMLGASFFFAHDHAECSDPNMFFSTIAYQLSKFDPAFKHHIIEGVTAHPSPGHASIPTQFEEFILKPLCKFSDGRSRGPIIVVIDALDECSDARKASEIVQSLSDQILRIPLRLKIFIASRPEPEIRSILYPGTSGHICQSFDLLQDVDAASTNEDIRRFLQFHLDKIGKEYELPSWPRKADVEDLAQQAGGLFIFAYTATEYIRDKDISNPESQLAALKHIGITGAPAFNLNELYSRILLKAIPETATAEVQKRIMTVIHTIVGLKTPLTLRAIERFLGLDRGAVRMSLNRLRSIFIVPDNDDDIVQVIHPSFARYIANNEEACSEKRFVVGRRELHSRLAKRCLKQMKTHLKQNICNFKNFTTVEAQIKNDADVVSRSLSEEVKYSCQNFAAHVYTADRQDRELGEMVAEWANQSLPYWLEVLALTGSFCDALPSLWLLTDFCDNAAANEVETPEVDEFQLVDVEELPHQRLLVDAIRMVSESYDDIKRFPHQIYTCLAFTPFRSPLSKQYSQLSTVRVLHGRRKNWEPLLHAVVNPDGCAVLNLTFSLDGKILASHSSVGRILLWNLVTSESRFLAHHTPCSHTAFAFSMDGNYIAAGGNVYSVATGEEVLIPGITSAFSPDGSYIALGYANGVIKLHDMRTQNLSLLGEFSGHLEKVTTLAFSKNEFLASASLDNTIRVWDCNSRNMIKQISSPGLHRLVTFSSDGNHVTAHYHDSFHMGEEFGTYIWAADIQTGAANTTEVLNYVEHPKESMTVFSQNGKYIASGYNREVYVIRWVAATEELTILLRHEFSSAITSISFTPDEKSLILGNEQGLIMSWQILEDRRAGHTFDFQYDAHCGDVQRIIFSQNGKYLTSASIDGSICVWDFTIVQDNPHWSNLACTSTLCGQTATFAPNGKSVAIGSGNIISKIDATNGHSIFQRESTPYMGNRCFVFSADGKYLTYNSPHELLFWDTGNHHTLSKRPQRHWEAEDLIVAHALSPDAAHYAVWFSTRGLWVHNLRSGESRTVKQKEDFLADLVSMVGSGHGSMSSALPGLSPDSKPDRPSPYSMSSFSPESRHERSPYSVLSLSPGNQHKPSPYSMLSSSPSSRHSSSPYSMLNSSPYSMLNSSPYSMLNSSPYSLLNFSPNIIHSSSPYSMLNLSPYSMFSSSPDIRPSSLPYTMLNFSPYTGLSFLPDRRLCFSPDNKYLITRSGAIWVFEIEKGVGTYLDFAGRSDVFDCAFSPRGQRIAIAHINGLDVLGYFTESPNVVKADRQGGYWSVEFSPDGKYALAAAGHWEEGQLDLFDADTLEILYTVKIWSGYVSQAMREFRRTGRLLNHKSSEYEDFPYLLDKNGWVITASSKRLCRLPMVNRGEVYDVNGNRIVVVTPEGKVTLIQFGLDPICISTPP